MTLLCDGRLVCGCADPYGKRVLGDTRTSSVTDVWTGETATSAADVAQQRRIEVLRRLSAEAAVEERRAAAAARPGRRRTSLASLRGVHGRVQHLLRPGLLRAGNRHHPDAPGRHARLRAVQAGHRRSRSVARTCRLLQLRRGVPAQARDRDVRVHQGPLSAHLSLLEHERARLHRGERRTADSLGHRRGHVFNRRRQRGELRQVPAAR